MKFMLQSSVVAQLLCLGAVAEWTEPPHSTAIPNTIKDCTWWFVTGASDTCERVTATYGITQAQLVSYNPVLSTSCTFTTGNSYCIEQNWGAAPAPAPPSTTAPSVPTTLTTTTTTTRAATTTTTPGNGVATPTPIQPGMVSNCNKFYFVASGVTCSKVLGDENISLADFVKRNPNVGAECTGMWAEVNGCVGVIGGAATPPTTTTKPPPRMVTSCRKFHYVSEGNTCGQIISYNGITLANFVKWNTGVGATCQNMWATRISGS
ncbi:Putative LysM domain-containing protein [Colletotrichum destructivum]|uniref:LysM domain-containing protein n=1 Tax=Colletotrichum destructivum TaxID=34406 RepID=A0AAX4IY10_9PEZI|nr:Putative LysM domain-containing protein [Colletotrichum destructivum]